MKYKLIPVNFNAYELPQFKESKKGKWYEYGTAKPYRNTYPDYLTYLYDKSSKQSQIINSKVKIKKGKQAIKLVDMLVGDRVTVYYKKSKSGGYVVSTIRVLKKKASKRKKTTKKQLGL